MEIRFQLRGDVLRVDVRDRQTAGETRELAERIFAERQRCDVLSILIVVRESRPIFKVEEYDLSGILERIRSIPGLRVAVVTDERELHAAHEYIEVLASHRDVPYRAFTEVSSALAWLTESRAVPQREAD